MANTKSSKMADMVLRNSVVLGKIAEKLPVWTLRDLRTTCQLWNNEFTPQLKKNHANIEVGSNMGDLVRVLRSSQAVPFAGFRFCDPSSFFEFMKEFGSRVTRIEIEWRIESDTTLDVNELRNVIFDFCPELYDLRLDIYSDRTDDLNSANIGPKLLELESGPVQNLPNLKRFSVTGIFHGHSALNLAFQHFSLAVIQSAKELEVLSLDGDGGSPPQDKFTGPMLSRLLQIDLPHLNKLKKLHLNDMMTNIELFDLVQLAEGARRGGMVRNRKSNSRNAFKLDTFTANVLCLETNPLDGRDVNGKDELQLIHNFLAAQSQTLRKLTMYTMCGPDDEDPKPCCLPRMERLEIIEFIYSTFAADQFQFTRDGGTFWDTFPGLRQFSYSYMYWSPFCAVDRLFHPGVTTLKLESTDKDFNNFLRFAPIFPSLTRLELTWGLCLRPDDETHIYTKDFAKIWTTWPALVALKIEVPIERLDLDLDVFITGVPRAGLERLRHHFLQNVAAGVSLDSLRTIVEKFKTRAGISDLKQLLEFTITFHKDKGDEIPQLTDTGAYFGVALASPSLQRLVIQGHRTNLVSEQCRTFITNTFGPLAEISL